MTRPRYPGRVPAADAQQLHAHQRRLRSLATQLARPGFVSSGSLASYYTTCGHPNCRCHADPPRLHGPYWQWSYRPAGGKTVTRKLNQHQARLYEEWIANRRRLMAVIAEMEEVSRQAAEIMLAPARGSHHSQADQDGHSPAPARRITRTLAESLTQLAEMLQPTAEAAEEWLQARDADDREALANARQQLLQTLDDSPDLASTITRLARLIG